MKLLLDYSKIRSFAKLLREVPNRVSKIEASIAYSSSDNLLKLSKALNVQFDWFGLFRYDEATSFDLIRRALDAQNVRFYPVTDFFHPKLIYFHDFGVYLGSANMSDNALYRNIEAGVFLSIEELKSDGRLQEIEDYFSYLRKHTAPFSEEDWQSLQEYRAESLINLEKKQIHDELCFDAFETRFSHFAKMHSASSVPSSVADRKARNVEKRKLSFMREWRETQNYLAQIKSTMLERQHIPIWLGNNPEPTITTDQFLHAYYYAKSQQEGNDERSIIWINNEYERNKANREQAVLAALKWWGDLVVPPSNEDKHILEWAPKNRALLAKDRILRLSEADFVWLMIHNHAAINHARQIRNVTLELPNSTKMELYERTEIYAKWLYRKKTASGRSILEVIYYLLWEDSLPIEERIFILLEDSNWRIEHLGRSILGELAGWGRPDLYHLRNNRVNKALRALGFDVFLYSD